MLQTRPEIHRYGANLYFYFRIIQSYSTGIDAVLESDRIKNEIFEYEQDLWEY